ncbi:MAG: CBS domain-containing protein [Nitrososphaerota archaeon]|nr:CBS domain-containing protein [Nitrososphaerota archaeon]
MTSLERKFSLIDLSVKSVMTKQVKTIEGNKPLIDCVNLMKAANIGSVIVLENGRPVGIFTERDLVNRMAEKPENLGFPMTEVMTTPLTTISTNASIWDAITLMGKLGIRRLPAIENGKLEGILTERDVLRLLLAQQNLILESVSESIPAATKEQFKAAVSHLGIEKPPSRVEEKN